MNSYDEQERLISSIDPLGYQKTFTYDANNNILSENGPNGELKKWVYDKADRRVLEDDSGLITKNLYNKMGKVVRSTNPADR